MAIAASLATTYARRPLKYALQLTAIRRGTGRSPRDIAKFRFPDDNEQRLSAWMAHNLRYTLAAVMNDVRTVERRLIPI